MVTLRCSDVDYDESLTRVEILDDADANIGTYFESREEAPEQETEPGNGKAPEEYVPTTGGSRWGDSRRFAVLAMILAILALFVVAMAGCSGKQGTTVGAMNATVPTTAPQAPPSALPSVAEAAPASLPLPSENPSAPIDQTPKPAQPDPMWQLSASIEDVDAEVQQLAKDLERAAPDPQKPVLQQMAALYSAGPLLTHLRQWLDGNHGSIDKSRAGQFQARLAALEKKWQQVRVKLAALGRRQIEDSSHKGGTRP